MRRRLTSLLGSFIMLAPSPMISEAFGTKEGLEAWSNICLTSNGVSTLAITFITIYHLLEIEPLIEE